MNNSNFFSLLQNHFSEDKSKIFLECPGMQNFSYGDIEPLTAKIANLFIELGVQPGARVVAQIPKSPMAVMLYLACLRSGVIFTPLNTAYTVEEVDYFLQDAAPALLICEPDKVNGLVGSIFKHAIPAVLGLDELGEGTLSTNIATISDQHKVVQLKPDAVAVIIYTSGTTGKPKGAMLSHGNLASNALSLYELWGWKNDDVLIHALPIFHVHGLFVALHLALLGGSTVKFLRKFDAGHVIDLFKSSSVLMGVPTFYTRLLKQAGLDKEACSNIRLFISGSAPLLEETFKHFQERTGHTILERYGMSETGMLTSNPLTGERIAGTVGFPLPEVSIRICDAYHQDVAMGDIGVLHVKGASIFNAYWRKEELSQRETIDGYFITGDLVKTDLTGRISLVGRNSDLIISGGFNVYPKEVELVLDQLDDVQESAVFGVPHDDLGEAVVAVVVPQPDADIDPAVFKKLLSLSLASYKVPKEFIVLTELPRNTMSKVQKSLLRQQYQNLFKAG